MAKKKFAKPDPTRSRQYREAMDGSRAVAKVGSGAARARWIDAWGLPPETVYLGEVDPMPAPPGELCKPCLPGETCVYWTEAQPPHRGWRCIVCHPPSHLQAEEYRTYRLDPAKYAAAAPEPKPPPAPPQTVTVDDNWWEE